MHGHHRNSFCRRNQTSGAAKGGTPGECLGWNWFGDESFARESNPGALETSLRVIASRSGVSANRTHFGRLNKNYGQTVAKALLPAHAFLNFRTSHTRKTAPRMATSTAGIKPPLE